jgi:hypothetical protein
LTRFPILLIARYPSRSLLSSTDSGKTEERFFKIGRERAIASSSIIGIEVQGEQKKLLA